MHNFLAPLICFLIAMPVYSAGLGFNPFDRKSPTSATGSAKPSPATPAPTSPPPKVTPSQAPVSPAKPDAQPAKPSNSQGKK